MERRACTGEAATAGVALAAIRASCQTNATASAMTKARGRRPGLDGGFDRSRQTAAAQPRLRVQIGSWLIADRLVAMLRPEPARHLRLQ